MNGNGASVGSSRPARGAWVEILVILLLSVGVSGRAPQGARGLKYARVRLAEALARRAPQGARGLKSICLNRVKRWSGRAPQKGGGV